MVQGDSSHVTVEVQQGAHLGVTTQGPNRIYKNTASASATSENNDLLTCRTHLEATVAQDACLVLAQDPTGCLRNCGTTNLSKFIWNL